MYLKRLELQGFKTFASPTVFEFGRGITAIVGPNGSGKSNIADAIRWALGEQNLKAIRSKRSEDVIFAGSPKRAPLGMAEVSLTLDNSAGLLPLPYVEVTITRRAYRSGENEYLINNQRVRWRDVNELLLKGNLRPNSCTVVGQGLIDAALSLRPEERRALLEEVADIRRYQHDLADAREKLQLTEQNSNRLSDIIGEILPRLRSLQKEASQAREYEALAKELNGLLQTYYGQIWNDTKIALREIEGRAQDLQELLAKNLAEQEDLEERLAQQQRLIMGKRGLLTEWGRKSEGLHKQLGEWQQHLTLAKERQSALGQQRDDLEEEIETLQAAISTETESILSLQEKLRAMETEGQSDNLLFVEIEGDLCSLEKMFQPLTEELTSKQKMHSQLTAQIAELGNRLSQLGERREVLLRALDEHQAARQRDQLLAAEIEGKLSALRHAAAQLGEKMKTIKEKKAHLQTLVAEARTRRESTYAALKEREKERWQLQTRLEILSDWRKGYGGYFSGVKAILQAAKRGEGKGRLSGIIDIVGNLIDVPDHLETAIEVALGSHAQDIVVERWQDAERGIEYLKRNAAGRATFLPLDTLRTVGLSSFSHPGIIGVASSLVNCDTRYRAAIGYLLGHTIIVSDLAAARRLLKSCPLGWQMVTLGGEVVRPSGAITGGQAQERGGIIRRERERRDLASAIARLTAQIEAAALSLQEEQFQERQLADDLASLEKQEQELASSINSNNEAQGQIEGDAIRLRHSLDWSQSLAQQISTELTVLDDKEKTTREQLREAEVGQVAFHNPLEELRHSIEELEEKKRGLADHLTQLKMARAFQEREAQGQADLLHAHEAVLSRLESQLKAKKIRLEEAEQLLATIETESATVITRRETISREIALLDASMQRAGEELNTLEVEQAALQEKKAALHSQQMSLRMQQEQTTIKKERCCERLIGLRRQMAIELNIPEDLSDDELAEWLKAVSVVAENDRVEKDEEAVKRRLEYVRNSLRAMGPPNPRAVEEYEEVQNRYTFLSGQLEDLQQAVKSLRQVTLELERTMARQFAESFTTVDAAFRSYFTDLFGGGAARLVLTKPDGPRIQSSVSNDSSWPGVDIIAKPPGRRQQSLVLLSGGERALTGVALLFALLKVHPTPVCVIDEVDAALDEANILRFCETLRTLTERTQFIVVTHNRGTMEMADILYGVSKDEDGFSRTISVRLEDKEERLKELVSV
ncbi:MAG: chromosome segregation protein SMC [Chloroflexi bacterium]|nr:chromosome segregation protein SMC [Chloroflexota bacterium]MCL5074268.1 chromosome segregation protein SMC [Chloroflexota bacterium]